MPTYNLVIRDIGHNLLGEMGIAMKGTPDHFDPALRGDIIAHDIIEHHSNSHENGYIDEFMALGSFIAGRFYYGCCNKFGRQYDMGDVESDISSLVYDALCGGDDFMNYSCNSYVQDKELMNKIGKSVRNGIIEGYDQLESEWPENLNEMVRNITGWICKGIQKFNNRFSNKFMIVNNVFSEISNVCDEFLKNGEEYQQAKLYVNFTTGQVYLEEVWV